VDMPDAACKGSADTRRSTLGWRRCYNPAMQGRTGVLLCLVAVALASLWTYEPRLHHDFPSMVDDWSAIKKAPDQLHDVLRLGNPEENRYRPGFVMWNALQWHTFGAPTDFLGPKLWGIARWAVLVTGLTLLALLLVGRPTRLRDGRWLLAIGVPLVAITAPSIAIDIARYGPQEPLLVGCMSLGAVLLVRAIDRLLDRTRPSPLLLLTLGTGLVIWAFGVLQKETSLCVLLLAPFLWPTIRDQQARWALLDSRRRHTLQAVAAAVLLPFAPILARTAQLTLSGDRVYEGASAGKSFATRLSDQLSIADDRLHTTVPMIVGIAAIVLLAAVLLRTGIDWLSIGLLATALGFIVFAAHAGVVASRYYIPPITLAALALARCAVRLGPIVVLAVGVLLTAGGLVTAWGARDWVWEWVDTERTQETLVREAQARAVGGCRVSIVGLNVEFVLALPVLMPLADEPPRDCAPGERFVAVLDEGGSGTVHPPDDPVLVACGPDPEPILLSSVGTILRCRA
jgi:hypothetical protein